MPTWRSRTPRSRTCSPEHCNAVCETTGARRFGAGAWPARCARVSGGEALAGGVLSASDRARARGCDRHRGTDRGGGRSRTLVLLKVFRSTAPSGASMESQARAPRVLRAAAESAAVHEAAGAASAAPTVGRAAAAEPDQGAVEPWTSIPASRVIRVLEELIALHGRPAAIRVDNGPDLLAPFLVDCHDGLVRVPPLMLLPRRSSRGQSPYPLSTGRGRLRENHLSLILRIELR